MQNQRFQKTLNPFFFGSKSFVPLHFHLTRFEDSYEERKCFATSNIASPCAGTLTDGIVNLP
jgi:hypothetical protein